MAISLPRTMGAARGGMSEELVQEAIVKQIAEKVQASIRISDVPPCMKRTKGQIEGDRKLAEQGLSWRFSATVSRKSHPSHTTYLTFDVSIQERLFRRGYYYVMI